MISVLADVKGHLKVEHTDDDALITLFINAAEKHVNDFCDTGETPFVTFPSPVAAAVLLIVGDLYENREAQTQRELYRNKTVDFLLQPYRSLGV